MTDRMRCPRCGNWRTLSLIEIHEESGATNYGIIRIDGLGSLMPPSDFWFEAGDPILTMIKCGDCGHEWKPRRQAVSSIRETDDSGLIECPHWSPGRITMRRGCTACAANPEPHVSGSEER